MLDESKTRVERINRKVKKKQRMIRVALGQEKADVVLKNAAYVNVFSNELCHGDIAVVGGLVVGMGDYAGETEYDMTGKIVVPGFIDAHIHLESSLVPRRSLPGRCCPTAPPPWSPIPMRLPTCAG